VVSIGLLKVWVHTTTQNSESTTQNSGNSEAKQLAIKSRGSSSSSSCSSSSSSSRHSASTLARRQLRPLQCGASWIITAAIASSTQHEIWTGCSQLHTPLAEYPRRVWPETAVFGSSEPASSIRANVLSCMPFARYRLPPSPGPFPATARTSAALYPVPPAPQLASVSPASSNAQSC